MPYEYQENEKVGSFERTLSYDWSMKKFNFSFLAMKIFAFSIKNGNLKDLTRLFSILHPLQKLGLLSLFLDFADMQENYPDVHSHSSLCLRPSQILSPYGSPIQIAIRYKQDGCRKFLESAMEDVAKELGFAKFDLFSPKMQVSLEECTQIQFTTSVHCAAKANDVEKLKKLDDYGISMKMLDSFGLTALDVALNEKSWAAVNWLIKKKVSIQTPFAKYELLLGSASEDGQLEFIKFFEKKYCPLTYHHLFAENGAIYKAANASQTEVVNYFLQRDPPPAVIDLMVATKKTTLKAHSVKFSNNLNFWKNKSLEKNDISPREKFLQSREYDFI